MDRNSWYVEENAKRIEKALENTYKQGINPEAVPGMVEALKSVQNLWRNEVYEFGLNKYNGNEEKAERLANNDKYVKMIERALKKAEL